MNRLDLHRRTRRRPRGTTLVELLVALPLALLVCALATLLLVQLARLARAQQSVVGVTRELRHAWTVLAHDLAPLRAGHVVAVSDSLMEFEAQLGVATLCEVTGPRDVLVTPLTPDDGSWLWNYRATDVLEAFRHRTDPGAPPVPVPLAVRRVTAAGAGPCGAQRAANRVRLTLSDSVSPLSIGTPVQLRRRTRYLHYRSGRSWWLGRQTLDVAGWDVVQPVAGPLLSPAANGVHFAPVNAAGVVSVPESTASLLVRLRAPRRVPDRGVNHDSVELRLSLHGDAFARRAP